MPFPTTLARTLGAGRMALGVILLADPDRITTRWLGPEGQTGAASVLARGLGVRDIVLGLGAAAAPPHDARRWVLAGVVADVADAVTSAASPGIQRNGRIGTVALAGGSAALGVALLAALD